MNSRAALYVHSSIPKEGKFQCPVEFSKTIQPQKKKSANGGKGFRNLNF